MDLENNVRNVPVKTAMRAAAVVFAIAGLSGCDPASSDPSDKAPAPQAAATLNLGRWQLTEAVNPLTDQKVVRIVQQAEGSDVVLSIACSKQDAWVHVFWADFLGGQRIADVMSTQGEQFELKNVTYRIGEKQPVTEEMLVLDDRTTTQIGEAGRFIEQVRTANRLVLQTQPYNENPKTVVFDTTGLTDILNAKRPECDWYVRDIIRAEYEQKKRQAEEEAKRKPPPLLAPIPSKPLPTPDPDALIK